MLKRNAVILLSVIMTAVGVALTYHVFENAIHESINAIWYDWLNTSSNRILVFPTAITIGLVFFGVQHYFDRPSESAKEHGLGASQKPTVGNLIKVLGIGFFSLLAGATLGPEAILVPASMIVGGLIARLVARDNKQLAGLLAGAEIMALFTAFFKSVPIGVLSLFLVTQQAKIKRTPVLFLIAIVASVTSYYTLELLDGQPYAQLPSSGWDINVGTVIAGLGLIIFGYVATSGVYFVTKATGKLRTAYLDVWWLRSLIASTVLALLYILGGPLVEFTGNQSILPLTEQASTLGIWSLIGIVLVKIVLIGWSKAIGYRGGMIFPMLFVASVFSVMTQMYIQDFNLLYGIISVIVGAFIANKKTRILV